MSTRAVPLCVDLDGTLLKTDLLWEALFQLLKTRPLSLFAVLLALLGGKVAFKAALVSRVALHTATLPLNQSLLARLRQERAAGRRLVLVTASPRPWAEAVAAELGLFDAVIATEVTGGPNLAGGNKAAQLLALYGERGFDYAGNSRADLPVWRAADEAWVVAAPLGVEASARALGRVVEVIVEGRVTPRSFLKAMRPHQWAKNVLVFLPLLTARHFGDHAELVASGIAFVAFSLAASATYLFNDLLDLASDRAHPRKCRRPFASGSAPLSWGAIGLPTLLLLAGFLALWLPPAFIISLTGYVVTTTAYSLYFKRQPLLDALVLAGLYTLRIFAGGAAIGVPITSWLLAFSAFFFLSLAFAKRYAELLVMLAAERKSAAGRGYNTDDLPLVQTLGIAAGYLSVLVMALYFDSPAAARMYGNPQALWVFCPVLLWWISRVWLLTHRGRMHDDPVVFALQDRASYLAAVLGVAGIFLATR